MDIGFGVDVGNPVSSLVWMSGLAPVWRAGMQQQWKFRMGEQSVRGRLKIKGRSSGGEKKRQVEEKSGVEERRRKKPTQLREGRKEKRASGDLAEWHHPKKEMMRDL